MCSLQINIIIIDFQLRVGVGWFTTQVGPRARSRFIFFMIVIICAHSDISRDGRWMQRGVAAPTIPQQAYDTINPQPIHCHFCQYSVFITPWIQLMRGTTVRDGLWVICWPKHVALWDWFNTRKARIKTPLLPFAISITGRGRVCGGAALGRHRPKVGTSARWMWCSIRLGHTETKRDRYHPSCLASRLSCGGRQPASTGRRVRCGRTRAAGN